MEPRTVRTDMHGHYELVGLAPGTYRLVSTFEYLNPEAIDIDEMRPRTVVVEEGRDPNVDDLPAAEPHLPPDLHGARRDAVRVVGRGHVPRVHGFDEGPDGSHECLPQFGLLIHEVLGRGPHDGEEQEVERADPDHHGGPHRQLEAGQRRLEVRHIGEDVIHSHHRALGPRDPDRHKDLNLTGIHNPRGCCGLRGRCGRRRRCVLGGLHGL